MGVFKKYPAKTNLFTQESSKEICDFGIIFSKNYPQVTGKLMLDSSLDQELRWRFCTGTRVLV